MFGLYKTPPGPTAINNIFNPEVMQWTVPILEIEESKCVLRGE